MKLEEAALALALSRRVGFDADRKKRVGASEVGRCARQTVAHKLGLDPDKDVSPTNGYAVRGDVMEDAWSAPLFREWAKAHGGELLYSGQAQQITFTGQGVPLSATPDGLAIGVKRDILKPYGVPDIGKSKQLVVELKSLDPRVGAHKLPKSPHVPQVITQMGMIRKATKYRPEWGIIAYTDASNYFDLKVYPIAFDERAFKSLVVRAQSILNAKDWDQMPPEGKIAGGSECNECPFQRRCLGFLSWIPGEDPRAPKPADVKKVETVAERVHKAKAAAEKASQAVRDTEAELYTVLNGVKRRFVMGKKYTVSAKATASQNRYDAKKLVAELIKRGGDPEKCRSLTKPGASISVEYRG